MSDRIDAIGRDTGLPDDEQARTRAVALRYEHARGAPKVVAKGTGVVADEILKRADEAGVFVHRSRELVSMLMTVDLDAKVPPELYTAVAEVLAWVYRQDEKVAQRFGPVDLDNRPSVPTQPALAAPATAAAPLPPLRPPSRKN